MAHKKLEVCDLDPFEFTLLYRRLRNVRTRWLAIIAPISVGVILLATSVDGTLGTFRDFQFWADIRRVLRVAHTPASQPDFSLMRDVTSWLLLIIIVSGALLLHRQWKYMAQCLSGLAENGAITARDQPISNHFSRLLRIDKIAAKAPTPQLAFHELVKGVVDCLSRRWVRLATSTLAGLASIAFAIFLVKGEQHGLFQVLAPPGLSPAARKAWLTEAYRSWWAGSHHFPGYAVYFLLAVFAIFIILSFEAVGLVATYVLIAMHFLVEEEADWLNRDGRFGWSPFGRVYRTVMWANVLLGAALSITLLALGIENYDWVAALVILYVILLPIFTIAPWLTFRNVEEKARARRVSEIDRIIKSRKLHMYDVEAMTPFIAEIDRCRKAKINPLRLGTASLSTYVIVIVLPVLLAAAQIVFPIRFGRG